MPARLKARSKRKPARLAASPLERLEWGQILDSLPLSPRQADIVALILRGASDKQIASTLGMSISTVRTHLRQIYARHNIADRVELILRVFTMLRGRQK